MDQQLERFRQAGLKGVLFQLGYQQPDGGYVWDGFANDAFHKQAYSWSMSGYFENAHRLLTWVADTQLQANGQLRTYQGDVYKHAWFFHGAHRCGRFDLSYPVFDFLASEQTPCGGLPHLSGDPLLRSLATCWTGVAAIYRGRLDVAERAAAWAMAVLEQQPSEDRFYFQTDRDGQLATEATDPKGGCVTLDGAKQPYWEIGLPLQLMCRLHQATGDAVWLERARPFFDFKLRCRTDPFAWAGSGKSSLGFALYYLLTGDRRGREKACKFGDYLVATQHSEGGWRDETESDELLIYIDHAAEFNVWLQEIAAILPAGDVRWGR